MSFDLAHPKHPDPATLLAWSEGELSWWRASLVKHHVRSCWQCKGQVAELEAIVSAVSLSIGQMPEPSRVDVAKAHWRFREAVRERDRSVVPERRVLQLRPSWAMAVGAALATAGLAYVASWPKFHAVETRPAPASRKQVRRDAPPPVLESRAAPPRQTLPPAAAPPQPVAAALPAVPLIHAETELAVAEIHALSALHRSRFCLSSGLVVRRAGSIVEVSGIVQSRDQSNRIAGILAGIARPEIVKLRLAEADDILRSAPLNPGSASIPQPEAKRVPPMAAWLRESVGVGTRMSERDMFNIMNAMALQAERVSSEAWALRHLAEQFPESRTRHLPADLVAQVLQMADDHAIAIANDLNLLQGRLELVSGGMPQQGSLPARASDSWQSSVLALQRHAEEVVRQVLASLSSDPGPVARSGAVADYAAVLRGLQEQTQACISLAGHLRSDLLTWSAGTRNPDR